MMKDEYEFLRVDVTGGIATVTLNRPPVNVLHIPMMRELNGVLEALLAEADLAALVLRAEGKAFCAGVDVKDHAADKVGEMIRTFHGIFRKLAGTDALTIAAVHAAALGGGCELAVFCDVVLAADRATFGQPEVQVGVLPPVAACVLPRQVGVRRAVELSAIGKSVSAQEAYAMGLVNKVYPADAFESGVDAYLNDVRKLSRPVVRLAKRATLMGVREQVLAQLDQVEHLYMNELMKLADAHEGIAAFLEKRPPVWKHA